MNAKEDQLAGRQRGGTLGRIPLQDEMPRQSFPVGQARKRGRPGWWRRLFRVPRPHPGGRTVETLGSKERRLEMLGLCWLL